MNREEIEKMFDKKFIMGSCGEILYDGIYEEGTEFDYVKQFIFDTVISEVLKSIIPVKGYSLINEFDVGQSICVDEIKQKAKELYNIDL